MTKVVTTTHNCHCEVTSSSVEASFSKMRLVGGIKIKVEQDMKILLPLSTDCECHEIEPEQQQEPEQKVQPKTIQPTKQKLEPEIQTNTPSSSAQDLSIPLDNEIIALTLRAQDLPKMDGILSGGSCDPYYIFFLDQGKGFKKMSGGAHLAIKNSRKGKWRFNIFKHNIADSKKMRIELWDRDSGKDEFIGHYECDSAKFLANGGFTNANLEGQNAGKTVLDFTYSCIQTKYRE